MQSIETIFVINKMIEEVNLIKLEYNTINSIKK